MAIAPHECKPGCYHGTEEISLGVSAYPKEIRGKTLNEYMYEIRKLNTEKGWRNDVTANDTGYEFAAYIALAHSELTETLEAYRDKQWSETRDDGKPIGIGPELADSLIRILDMCDIWGINIEHEMERVIKYGWTRPYKHGGRQL
jgi:NTP pyrophosphatase (non-canonical NTP hydrolase)